jgi:hypothetical protein
MFKFNLDNANSGNGPAHNSNQRSLPMKTANFLTELKRRDVYKVAVAYAVVAWLLIQAASILLPTFDAPACMMKGFVALLALGFIFSVVISWTFEITPEGIKRTADISADDPDIARQLEAVARQQFVRGYLFALAHARLGDKTKAIEYLEREYPHHDNIDTACIRVDHLPGENAELVAREKTGDVRRAQQPSERDVAANSPEPVVQCTLAPAEA